MVFQILDKVFTDKFVLDLFDKYVTVDFDFFGLFGLVQKLAALFVK